MAVPLVAGVLAISAVALGAATLGSAQSVGPTGDGVPFAPELPGQDMGDREPRPGLGDDGGTTGDLGTNWAAMTSCNDFLASTPGTLLVVAGLFALMGVLYHRYNVALSLFAGWTIAPPVALAYFMLTDCGSMQYEGHDGTPLPGGSEGLLQIQSVPSWVLGVVVGGALVVGAAVLYRTAGTDEVAAAPPSDDAEDDVDLGRFAAAAGRAADRIEERNVPADNAVYAAWVEMTDLLDVADPETYAPSEFAETAIDLGMAEDDVQGLTTLFNEVRYGGKDASVRAERAAAVLRAIESGYGTRASDAEGQDGT
jgi:hypothetical protein